MKIFLTEYQLDNKIYAGVNIFALDEVEAELIATENGVTIVGEVTGIKFKEEFDNYLSLVEEVHVEKRILH
jgi:hypothetical protein|tara:strand:+ start:168 stop:380 length:213 start_codon:yes stop_codon:yes gene_type:complete